MDSLTFHPQNSSVGLISGSVFALTLTLGGLPPCILGYTCELTFACAQSL